jgi:hypothetical protein
MISIYCYIYILIYKFKVNSRLYSKRAFFGSRAVQVVEDFFKTDRFVNNPEGIAQYAKWAVTRNGPALWRVPTPRGRKHKDEVRFVVFYIA